jgi:uncharacterized phage infection (PIP) family protein YhgE
MAALEEKAEQRNGGISILQSELGRLTTDFGGLAGEVSTLRTASAGITALSGDVSAQKRQIAEQILPEVSEL